MSPLSPNHLVRRTLSFRLFEFRFLNFEFSTLLCLLLAFSLAACSSLSKKKDVDKNKSKEPAMEDMSGDVTFQAFVGRLRKAVAAHDTQTVAEMMKTDFGYRFDPVGEGAGVFEYWDQENIWPQVQAVLDKHFVPKGNFMVAPPEFVTDPNFHGFRAGITPVNGVWKFAYFVTD